MEISKAVITAAGPGQHTLPLQRVVDRKGEEKTALQLIVDEAVQAGIEDICVVIQPGDEREYLRAAGDNAGQLCFVEQPAPLGYGDAIYRAAEFTGNDPFLHLVGDHLYLSLAAEGCAQQVVRMAEEFGCSVSAVQATRENKLPYFGAVSGSRLTSHPHLFDISRVVEKPTPTYAEQELTVAGLRLGYYLCFFGMHVLTPEVMEILGQQLDQAEDRRSIPLSAALSELSKRQRYLAMIVEGQRYNIGMQYGVLYAQLALALSGKDRDRILTELVDMLSHQPRGTEHE